MDVRCEKCGTEYELDEQRLSSGGVTVKCTQCEHLFKVRAPRATSRGISDGSIANDVGSAHSYGKAAVPDSNTREWMIRRGPGDVLRCTALATLQKWIVLGEVERSAEISLDGETWKPLSGITELETFFVIADQARSEGEQQRLSSSTTPEPQSPSYGKQNDTSRSAQLDAGTHPHPHPHPHPHTMESDNTPTLDPSGEHGGRQRGLSAFPPGSSIVGDPRAPGPSVGSQSSVADSGRWSAQGVAPNPDEEEAGPTGGFARSPSSQQVFSGSAEAPLTDGPERTPTNQYQASPYVVDDDEDDIYVPRSGAAKWIALLSLLALGGAFGYVYFTYLRVPAQDVAENPDEIDQTGDGTTDSNTAIDGDLEQVGEETPLDLETDLEADPEADLEAATERARDARSSDTGSRLEASLSELSEIRPYNAHELTEEKIPLALAQAQTELALANVLLDSKRKFSSSYASTQIGKKSTAKILGAAKSELARQIATKILSIAPLNGSAMVVVAEAERIAMKRSREIERRIRKGVEFNAEEPEAGLASARLLLRDKRQKEARSIFERLEKKHTADARAKYQLALLDMADENTAGAKKRLEGIFADYPEHTGAIGLLELLGSEVVKEQAPPVDQDDAMPPEVVGEEPEPTDKNGETAATAESAENSSLDPQGANDATPPEAETYDRLLEKGDLLAENGNCRAAIGYFKKALEKNDRGVSALTGLGDCQMERSNHSEALQYYRAALSISPRYQPALWGVARLYQSQGDKDNAIDAYKIFLEMHPNSRSAPEARRQIGILEAN